MTVLPHDTISPDIATSSDDYARRFTGPVGTFLLETQSEAVSRLLGARRGGHGLRALEVGGGHAQLTPLLLGAGFDVWVQGSSSVCARRLVPITRAEDARGCLRFVTSSLWSLPFRDTSFDLVVAIRLLAHVERWQALLAEMARVCRGALLIDYAPLASINLLEPVLFQVKRRIEGNTRPFFCHRTAVLLRTLRDLGFSSFSIEKEFFFPMVIHRAIKRRGLSHALESASRTFGLTRRFGSPSLLLAERRDIRSSDTVAAAGGHQAEEWNST